MIFGKHSPELSILNALARKGGVMKRTTEKQVKAGILFPGDFPKWNEEFDFDPQPHDLVEDFNKKREYRIMLNAAIIISRAVRDYLYRPDGPLYRRVKARFSFE
jgi:hypothetical protein